MFMLCRSLYNNFTKQQRIRYKLFSYKMTTTANNNIESIQRLPTTEQAHLIKTANIVCFDVDSTVVKYEGIDILASYHNVYNAVSQYTTSAMNGNITFQQALNDRLNIIKPNYNILQKCINEHKIEFTDSFTNVIHKLQQRNTDIYLISGGFIQMIEPIAKLLNISYNNIYANHLLFDKNNNNQYIDVDWTQPTSHSGGKAKAVQLIKQRYIQLNNNNNNHNDNTQQQQHHQPSIIMIGDGVTDLEARTECNLFIGYGGVALREKVRQQADVYITDWNYLLPYL